MATPPDIQDNPITGTVLFYSTPEPLNADKHGKLGLVRTDKPYSFAAAGHLTPLTVTEFVNAALSFPIIFVGEDRSPVAVLGLSTDENLFVDAEGGYAPGVYIPAYIRRYPFVLANDAEAQRMIVCVDRASSLLVEGGDVPLFDDKGRPTDYTNAAIKFCDDFEMERSRTESFVKLLNELELFERRQSHFTPVLPTGEPGEPQLIAEFWGVSEAAVMKLPPEKLVELRDNGALAHIYAHLLSLNGWDKLLVLAGQRQAANALN